MFPTLTNASSSHLLATGSNSFRLRRARSFCSLSRFFLLIFVGVDVIVDEVEEVGAVASPIPLLLPLLLPPLISRLLPPPVPLSPLLLPLMLLLMFVAAGTSILGTGEARGALLSLAIVVVLVIVFVVIIAVVAAAVSVGCSLIGG